MKKVIPSRKTIGCILLIVLFGACSFWPVTKIYEAISPEADWKAARENTIDNDYVARHYFVYFLAIQHESLYEITDPSLHHKLDTWITENDALTCGWGIPETWKASNKTKAPCSCVAVGEGLRTKRHPTEEYNIVFHWDSIAYECRR